MLYLTNNIGFSDVFSIPVLILFQFLMLSFLSQPLLFSLIFQPESLFLSLSFQLESLLFSVMFLFDSDTFSLFMPLLLLLPKSFLLLFFLPDALLLSRCRLLSLHSESLLLS